MPGACPGLLNAESIKTHFSVKIKVTAWRRSFSISKTTRPSLEPPSDISPHSPLLPVLLELLAFHFPGPFTGTFTPRRVVVVVAASVSRERSAPARVTQALAGIMRNVGTAAESSHFPVDIHLFQ